MSRASKVAIVGVAMTPPVRDSGVGIGTLALRAARDAIDDAGLKPTQIDGITGVFCTDHPTVWPGYVAAGLGIDALWSSSTAPPSASAVIEAANAIAAGACDYALCYHAKYRWSHTSASARHDPLRQSPFVGFDPDLSRPLVAHCAAAMPFAAQMRRHMHEFGSRREHFGMIAVNGRSWAQHNETAMFHGKPISLADYMAAPMSAEPFCLYDMDMPCDIGTAIVLARADKARDLPRKPVLIKASASGMAGRTDQIFQPFDGYRGARIVMKALWNRTGYTAHNLDVANVYDGFTSIAMDWIEAAFGAEGDGPGLLADGWDADAGIVRLLGRAVMNPHGGNLSEARTQGMGQIIEAVRQLRGEAGSRQVPGARLALATNGANPITVGMLLSAG